jgi:uncharacterized membrane protein YphA (DoxX/SURF4 family)
MKSQSSVLAPLGVLQLVLAVFFIATGLMFLVHYNSHSAQIGRALGEFFGKGRNNMLQLVTAILELCAGIVLVIGLVGIIPGKVMLPAIVIILILWAIQMVMTHFAAGFLKPDFLTWLQPFALNAVVLVGLWGCAARYTE